MVPSGHKTLVHYPDGTSKVITLYVRPLEGRIIAHGWEVTNVAPGENVGAWNPDRVRDLGRTPGERVSGRSAFIVTRSPGAASSTPSVGAGAPAYGLLSSSTEIVPLIS